uniref:Uncharacterized protein n=1 Tax=Clastoptera arizonana TaxID=38151 RepID=A0A1B6DXT9_9HEMI
MIAILTLLFYIAPFCFSFVSSLTILDKLKTKSELCPFPSKQLYDHDLFIYCDIPVPDDLKYGYLPLLCMGLYDVSLQLCDKNGLGSKQIKDIPQNKTSLNSILEKNKILTSNFCSINIYKTHLKGRKNTYNETKSWMDKLNHLLFNEQKCNLVCGTDSGNASPYCSLIVWVDSFYKNVKEIEETDQSPKEITETTSTPNLEVAKQNLESMSEVNDKLSGNKLDENSHRPISKEENQIFEKNENKTNLNSKSTKNEIAKLESDKIDYKVHSVVMPNNTKENGINEDKTGKTDFDNKVQDEKNADTNKFQNDPGVGENGIPISKQLASHTDKTPSPNSVSSLDVGNVYVTEQFEKDQEGIQRNEANPNIDNINQEEVEYENDEAVPHKEPQLQKSEVIQKEEEESSIVLRQEDGFIENEDSHFFTNFICLTVLCIIFYLVFHNKKKLLALAVEGKRRGPTRRRPNTASYSKLDCNLEEAMVSNTTASVTHVLY